jgi:hypothetical protein
MAHHRLEIDLPSLSLACCVWGSEPPLEGPAFDGLLECESSRVRSYSFQKLCGTLGGMDEYGCGPRRVASS